MQEIMCDAITCLYNCGNEDGKLPEQGFFKCSAPMVNFGCRDIESTCTECGYIESLEQAMDCGTYKRNVGEESGLNFILSMG